jgi:dihydrofolate reductase
MPAVIADMAMSLDGFVADADDGMLTFQPYTTRVRDSRGAVGAVICGRRSFDIAGGWGGRHPKDAPAFVVTHSVPYGWPRKDASVVFVTDGIESALEQAIAVARERTIAVTSPSVAQQFLNAGLLDGLRVSVVPVLLGRGVRFFGDLTHHSLVELESTGIVKGAGAIQLSYRVCRRRR